MSGITIDGTVNIPNKSEYSEVVETLVKKYRCPKRPKGYFEMGQLDSETDSWKFPRSAIQHFTDYVDLTTQGRLIHRKSKFIPRKGQMSVVEEGYRKLLEYSSLILNAPCGSGKTVMGAEIALRLGVTTCVLVHKEYLADQWEEAFRLLCPDIKIGRTVRDRCDTGNEYDVVIAMTQSLTVSDREYPEEFYKSFGLLIGDEVHRYAAEVWSSSAGKFPAFYRMGLTATARRTDGLWPVIEAHFGSVRAVMFGGDTMVPIIYPIKLTTKSAVEFTFPDWYQSHHKKASLVSELCENSKRNDIIVKNILKAYSSGRKIIAISERRKHISDVSDRLKAYGVEDIGFYLGGMKKKDLEEAKERQLIFTTYQMSSEGLDIPSLDVLVLMSPQAHIQQTVGRILRPMVGKETPVVLDFYDPNISYFKGIYYCRMKEYRGLGYDIK